MARIIRTSNDLSSWVVDEVDQKVVKPTVKFIFNYVVSHSPVLTGQFRASWDISLFDPIYKSVNSGTGHPAPKYSHFDWKPGVPVFISNGKAYGVPLEDGTSTKAPHGMIRPAMAAIKTFGVF